MPPQDSTETIATPPTMQQPSYKLFKLKDVIAGSIVGGPWAAAFFCYRNFKNTGNPKPAKLALVLGLAFPILWVLLAMIVPPQVPRFVFVGAYAGLITWLMQKYHTPLIKFHEQANGEFYSASRATVVTVVFLVGYMIAIVGGYLAYLRSQFPNATLGEALSTLATSEKFDTTSYNELLSRVNANDATALEGFTRLDPHTATPQEIIVAADKALPLYEANQRHIKDMAALKYTPSVLDKQNTTLAQYTDLRVEWVKLLKKAVTENTTAYDKQITDLVERINVLVSSLPKNEKLD